MRKKIRPLITLLLIVFYFLLISACTVVKIGDEKSGNEGEYSTWTKTGTGFHAADYVEDIWDDRLLPAYKEHATDYMTVISALQENREAAIGQYGLTRKTGEPFYIFKVQGIAVVDNFDDSSRNGVIYVDSMPVDGIVDATIQVGPVIRGTVIRDSVEFIRFTDVGNQLQFADLANELNNRMKKDYINPLDLNQIKGHTISFLGAFRLEKEQSLDDVIITPIKVTLMDSLDG